MSATLESAPRTRDAYLIIGVAALLCGIGAIGCGLLAPEAWLAMGGASGPSISTSARDALFPPGSWETSHTVQTHRVEQHKPTGAPALYRLDERRLSGSAEGLARAQIDTAAAHWIAAWSGVRLRDTVPAYLTRSSGGYGSAHWFRAITAWEATSGYGALESRRASNRAVVHDREIGDSVAASAAREPKASLRQSLQVLIHTGAETRDRGPYAVHNAPVTRRGNTEQQRLRIDQQD